MSEEIVDTVRLIGNEREAERFVILDDAIAGGMGVVFRARTEDGTIVALKVMNVATGHPARFALETSVLANLAHENIVGYHSHGFMPDGKPFLAMEWLDGETLRAVVERGPLPADEVIRIGRAIAAALVFAHANGVVHRDLKPSNVVLTKRGEVKLLDFGVARIVALGRGLTQTGEVVGTPGYMAPEQARGDDEVDARADLFALGCVLYRALSGRRPFEATSTVAYLAKLLYESPPPLDVLAPNAPPGLVGLVTRLLARAPADRPASAAEVLASLSGDLARASITARTIEATADRTLASPGPAPAPPAPPRRGRAWIAIPVLAIALVAGTVGVSFVRHGDAIPTPSAAPPAGDSAALVRACNAWAGALARAQRPAGFSGEQHRPPSGWDTAQQLFALARAKHACGAPEAGKLVAGTTALDGYRADAGWTGLGATPVVEVPVAAWSSLAATALSRVEIDAGGAREATTKVAAAATNDGFSFHPGGGSVPGALYASVMGTWAVVAAATDKTSASTRSAVEWLERALQTNLTLRATGGLEEQATWVLLAARANGWTSPKSELLDALAKDIVARCGLDAAGACTRPLSQDDRLSLATNADGDESIIQLWHPWLTLAAHTLAGDPSIQLSPSTREAVRAVDRWSMNQLTSSIAVIGLAPEYKIAEYLIVVTLLLDPMR